MKRKLERHRKGVVMLMFGAIMLFILCPAVGLAIDVGVAYAAKARLQSAADGAVIAATRALSHGMSDVTRRAAATVTAQRFFTANLNGSWLGTTGSTVAVEFPPAPPKTTLMKVTVTADISTYFLRLIGSPSMKLKTVSAASRRDVNIMLVLDRSGSMESSGSCGAMREAAKSFVLTFQEGRDKVGLITFGTSYRVDKALTANFRTGATDIITHLDNINCTGWTNAAAAYSLAYNQLRAMNEPGVLNAILFFTDGMPNTVTMPRILLKDTTGCTITGNRFGVISQGGGIFKALAESLPPVTTETIPISNNAGCAFALDTGFTSLEADVVALTRGNVDGNKGGGDGEAGDADNSGPGNNNTGTRWDNWPVDADAFGNSLFGYKSVSQDGSGRIVLNSENVMNAGINALTNAGMRVRGHAAGIGLDVMTFSIGLGAFGTGDTVEILHRVSNSLDSPVYDPTKPKGRTIVASVAGELEGAFSEVAAEMLRLAM